MQFDYTIIYDDSKKIVQEYPLVNKVDFSLDCYMLKKRRYLIF